MKVYNRSEVPDINPAPVIAVTSGSAPRTIQSGNNRAVKKTVPAPGTSCKQNIQIEYRKGIIIINGKKINLPDTDKMLAQFSLKGKKITFTEKNRIDIHLND